MKTKLTNSTPKLNVILWQLGTFLFALSIFINENKHMIAELGLSTVAESRIKVLGIFIYFIFTFYNFNQSAKPKTP